jgi:hypothetical protein
MPVSQRVQMNFIFNDNVRILCLSCNVKKVGKLVRFKQKGQKEASFKARTNKFYIYRQCTYIVYVFVNCNQDVKMFTNKLHFVLNLEFHKNRYPN